MHGTVDASGGTLTGAADTVFEGLSLVVPPGALSAATDIVITQSEDPTPLPVGARRIGPQFSFAPKDLALAQPATLTLPANPDEVASYGSHTSDMKVWSLVNGAWARSEPTATAEGLVTIDFPGLTTVAAGVKILTVPASCTGPCLVAKLSACTTIGFCVKSFGTLAPTPEDSYRSFVVSGTDLYWTTATPAGIEAVRQPLGASGFAGPAATSGTPVPGLTFQRNNPAVRVRDGSYWIGTGGAGNVVFGFDGISTRVFTILPGLGTVLGYGAVVAGSDFAMLTPAGGYTMDPPNGSFSILGEGSALPNIVIYKRLPAPATAGNYVSWTSIDASGLTVDTRVVTNDLDDAVNGEVARGIGPTFETSTRFLQVDLAPDGTLATLSRDTNVPDYIGIWNQSQLVAKVTLPAPLTVGRFAFDSLGALWISVNNAPQIFRRAPDGTLDTIALTSAPATSPDNTNATPDRILATNEPGAVVIITLGKQLYHATYGGAH
jgi:hypothetical protein